MNILYEKRRRFLSYIVGYLILSLIFSCSQNEIYVTEINNFIEADKRAGYRNSVTFWYENKLYSIKEKAVYDFSRNLLKVIVYYPEGTFELERNDLIQDEKLLQFYGFPLKLTILLKNSDSISINNQLFFIKERVDTLIDKRNQSSKMYILSNSRKDVLEN